MQRLLAKQRGGIACLHRCAVAPWLPNTLRAFDAAHQGCLRVRGLLQFARGINDGNEYAIKFFTVRGAFEREEALYSNSVIQDMMPAVKAIEANADGKVRALARPCSLWRRVDGDDVVTLVLGFVRWRAPAIMVVRPSALPGICSSCVWVRRDRGQHEPD